MSIHELDTTPRDERAAPSAPIVAPAHTSANIAIQQTPVRAESGPTTPPPYEVVSDSNADKTKGGWWRKLTGQ